MRTTGRILAATAMVGGSLLIAAPASAQTATPTPCGYPFANCVTPPPTTPPTTVPPTTAPPVVPSPSTSPIGGGNGGPGTGETPAPAPGEGVTGGGGGGGTYHPGDEIGMPIKWALGAASSLYGLFANAASNATRR